MAPRRSGWPPGGVRGPQEGCVAPPGGHATYYQRDSNARMAQALEKRMA